METVTTSVPMGFTSTVNRLIGFICFFLHYLSPSVLYWVFYHIVVGYLLYPYSCFVTFEPPWLDHSECIMQFNTSRVHMQFTPVFTMKITHPRVIFDRRQSLRRRKHPCETEQETARQFKIQIHKSSSVPHLHLPPHDVSLNEILPGREIHVRP